MRGRQKLYSKFSLAHMHDTWKMGASLAFHSATKSKNSVCLVCYEEFKWTLYTAPRTFAADDDDEILCLLLNRRESDKLTFSPCYSNQMILAFFECCLLRLTSNKKTWKVIWSFLKFFFDLNIINLEALFCHKDAHNGITSKWYLRQHKIICFSNLFHS